MTLLPIVARELRVAARRRGGHWSRVVAALLALVVGTFVYATIGRRSVSELGLVLFVSLAWLAFVFRALAGARLTADAISEERREGTLGLLFLTDLKGHDIVLGKLAASSVNALYSLLAIVPILGIALLFGGVTGTQFWKTILVLLNTMAFSLALGICVSAWFENGRRAAAVTVLLLVGVTLGPLLLAATIGARAGSSGSPESLAKLFVPSPGFALAITAVPGAPGFLTRLFWPSVGLTFGLALVCLVASSLVVPRVWHDLPTTARRLAWRRWRADLAFGVGVARAAFRQRLLALNPFCWLTSRDRLRPLYVWAVFAASGLCWLWGRLEFGNEWEDSGALLTWSQCLYGVVKLWIAAAVVMRLAEDRRNAALELILTTPLGVRDIRRGLSQALQRQFRWPLVVLLLLDTWFLSITMRQMYGEREEMLGLYAARMSLLVLDVVTLWALGPWVAVTARHANQAAANLLVRVCVLPWIVFLLVLFGVAIAQEWGWARWNFGWNEGLAAWFGLGLLNDLGWLAYAASRTDRQFREASAARFDRRGGWWRALWRFN
jgi:ABC-type transport system involved in multi-copper enzyme maturation permease subunit